MLRLLPRPPDGLDEVFGRDRLSARKVPRGDFRVDLDARVHWDKVFWSLPHIRGKNPMSDDRERTGDIVALADGYSRLHDRVVFPAHHKKTHISTHPIVQGVRRTCRSWKPYCRSS